MEKNNENLKPPKIMVSILSIRDFQITEFLKSLGFKWMKEVDRSQLEMEITGGYYSYLRGDRGTSGGDASVFDPRHMKIFEESLYALDEIYFFRSLHVRSDRIVVHFMGPDEETLKNFIKDNFIDNPKARESIKITSDLERAFQYWGGRFRDMRSR